MSNNNESSNKTLDDKLKDELKIFFDHSTITFVGSGLSIAESIPGMKEIAEKLLEAKPEFQEDQSVKCWEEITSELQKPIGLEQVFRNSYLLLNEEVEKFIKKIVYEIINNEDKKIFKEVVINKRKLKLTEYLSKFNLKFPITIITTNYDLLIEYACEQNNIGYYDFFYNKLLSKFGINESKNELFHSLWNGTIKYKPHIKLLKLHGSLNWKEIRKCKNEKCNDYFDGEYYKLNNHIDSLGEPCIITPGLNKYKETHYMPFYKIINEMREEIENATQLVFIGYGFNDEHLETVLNDWNKKNNKLLIISKELNEKAKELIKKNTRAIGIESDANNENKTKIYWNGDVENGEIKEGSFWEIDKLIEEIF